MGLEGGDAAVSEAMARQRLEEIEGRTA